MANGQPLWRLAAKSAEIYLSTPSEVLLKKIIIIMADGGDNIFIYMGGEQVVPLNVSHVIIDRSVKIIPARAFYNRRELVSVKMHKGIERIEDRAFCSCTSLREIKKSIGVREIGGNAFHCCVSLICGIW